MKKKLFLLLLFTAATLLCSCNLQQEGNATESESAHIHAYGDWEIIKEATCTEEGKKIGACSCGDKLVEVIPMLDHILVKDLGLSPTCTQPGLSEKTFCAVCYTLIIPQETIPPTGHFEVIDEAVAPTCTSDGLTEGKHCYVCNEILAAQEKISAAHLWEPKYDQQLHWQECAGCGLKKDQADHTDILSGYCTVCNAPIAPTDGIVYSIGEGADFAAVTGYNGSLTDIVIANEYNGLPVSVISEKAFSDKEITSVFIPDSVKIIGQDAFSACSSLKRVKMSNSIKEIGSGAFKNCTLLQDILLPDSLARVDESSFEGCDKLIETENGISYVLNIALSSRDVETAVIRDGTTLIAEYAFAQNADLVSLTLPDSVVRIGDGAFSECTKLSSLTLGKGLEHIGEFAFYWCTSIESITLPDSLTDIGHSAFLGCIKLANIDLGSSLSSIAPYAFADCSALEDITVPSSVKSIGACAFYHCTALKSMTLPFVGETRDGNGASHFGYIFGATSSYTGNGSYVPNTLKKVILTNAIIVEDHAFFNCSSIESISLPVTVFFIGDGAFSGCSRLSEINVPDGLASLGKDAFSNCENLQYNKSENVLYLGNRSNPRLILIAPEKNDIESCKIDSQVKFIYDGAFSACTSLKEVIYSGTQEEWQKVRIGDNNSPLENANLTFD